MWITCTLWRGFTRLLNPCRSTSIRPRLIRPRPPRALKSQAQARRRNRNIAKDNGSKTMPLTEVKTQPLDSVRIPKLIREVAEPISDIERGEIDSLIERAGAARVVLIGEASHGTSEFYRMRARITRELIERKGFNIVAIEGDWPDAARINNYIQRNPSPTQDGHAFTRFPTWMWRNREVAEFIGWLRGHNDRVGD
ncbi:erythromycin esterase family protein, partial [Candidatus Sumerlaeota bacterium]|nr:erythromycin esterase family protein [Candidatus Sumerlaeota bacterium]